MNQINSQSETFINIKDALILNQKIGNKDLDKNNYITIYITAFGTSDQIEYNQKTTNLLSDETVILKS